MEQLRQRETLNLKLTEVIEPAQGEEKVRLERDCVEYLQSPDKTSVPDFLKFTENMIALIGGKKSKEENELFSYPLLHSEAQTPMVFKVRKLGELTVVEIETKSTDKLERLSVHYYSLPSEYSSSYVMNTRLNITFPSFDSYITGKKEPVSSGMAWIASKNLEPNEAKDFARKVFGVYQRQEQQAQLPTPQP